MELYSGKVIFHVDADSFFASVERASHPEWGDTPVCVTAHQGGCILAATYELKRLGVKTGMPLWEAKKILKDRNVQVVKARFHIYARFSDMIFRILREFSPDVEEASVDEAYMDMTGLRSLYRMPHINMARVIQERVKRELGVPVSIGIGSTKTLAKIATKKAKPAGVHHVRNKQIPVFLQDVTFDDVPGIGYNSAALLRKFGISTVTSFIHTSSAMVQRIMHKPGVALWQELQGTSMFPVVAEDALPQSLSRIRSFPVTDNLSYLEAELLQHVLLCTYKLRGKNLTAKRFAIYVRDSDFNRRGEEWVEEIPHANALRFLHLAKGVLKAIVAGKKVRSVGIVFTGLHLVGVRQPSLFGDDEKTLRQEALLFASDRMNKKYGKFMVRPATLDSKFIHLDAPREELLRVPYLGEVG